MNLQIQSLKRTFAQGTKGLQEFNLVAHPGEVIAILGPNGAGKTTMIKTMLNWIDAEAGQVQYFGKMNLVQDREKVLQRVGYVSDEHMLVEKYSVDQMISMIRPHYVFWDTEYEEELVQKFGLPRKEKIKNLSRGMKAKLALLLALSYRPDLLIMDEATSGLDPRVREEALRMLVEYCSEYNKTVLYATHLLDEVNRIATRVVILSQGKVVFECATEELEDRVISLPLSTYEKLNLQNEPGYLGSIKDMVLIDLDACSEALEDAVTETTPDGVRLDELFLTLTEDTPCH